MTAKLLFSRSGAAAQRLLEWLVAALRLREKS